MAINEGIRWTGRPNMSRHSPIGFLCTLLLCPLGIGLVVFLFWRLWCLSVNWTATQDWIIQRRGILSKSTTALRLVYIQSIRLEQNFFQRLIGTGTIRLTSISSEEIVIFGIVNPEIVNSLLMNLLEPKYETPKVEKTNRIACSSFGWN
jgi:uncharacterized membrane protein YdbT with pleckstrin-like domain